MGEDSDLGTERRRLWLLVHNTSIWIGGVAGPNKLPPQEQRQGHGSRSQGPLLCARAVLAWPGINIPEGSKVSLGCSLSRRRLTVPLEVVCECLWSNKLKGNAKAVPACFLAWT